MSQLRPQRQHTVGRVLWRWFSGAHLDGVARTDRGWTVRGQTAWTRHGRARRAAYRPRLRVAAVRTSGTIATAGGVWAYVTHPTATMVGGSVVLVLTVAAGTALTVRRVQVARHVARHVRPLHGVLAGPLGVAPDVRPEAWIEVPRDYDSHGREITLRLPQDVAVTAELRRYVADQIGDKLGLSSPAITWHTVGRRATVTIRPAVHAPDKVTVADVRDAMLSAPESAPVIGLSATGPVAVDLDAEAPHVLVSMSTGAGKSATIRTLAAQLVRNGCQVIVIDAKRVSQGWLRDRPGVTYCRTAERAHVTLVGLLPEMERRYEVIDAASADEIEAGTVDVGPRIVILFEEMNAMMGKLIRHWQETRTKSDPKQSPAISAFHEILCMGRQGRINVIAVAQLATARTVGGPEARENFAVRILGRYTRNAWLMLAPEVWPMPRASKRPGRVQVVQAGAATETQVTYMTLAEAREWASGAPVTVPAAWVTDTAQTPVTVTDVTDRDQTPGPAPAEPQRSAEPARYTLAAAAREPWCRLSYDALRQARSRAERAGEWPAGRVAEGRVTWTKQEILSVLSNRARASEDSDAN